MLAATVFDIWKNASVFTQSNFVFLLVGIFVSFIAALVSVKLLVGFLKKHNFVVFCIYRILIALFFWLVVKIWYNYPMKIHRFKIISILLAFAFLFMALEADICHNHEDFAFHNDCPGCLWLIISIFIFVVISSCLGLLHVRSSFVFITRIKIPNTNFKPENYLRSPPVLFSL